MESLSSPSRALPSHHPFLAPCFTQPRTTPPLHFPIKFPNYNRYKFLFHAASPLHRPPKNTLSAVAEAAPAGGDLTGLIQNGVLLLSIYWFANFVIPGLMSKNFEPVASETEKETEEETAEEEEEVIQGGEMKQGANLQANVKAKRRRGRKKTASSR
ncbi:uncharacterized protein LOC122052534 isoform X1 [Zingiber officinale]|uniref:uncharacterized protein LOC122052534 isoform X1 n=1 Tax=Zingiber officinale TaxID=94328 RepID=UPI001C4B4797|nr:uncharacterized protein LOC122052534 isoform X1 [Zingiber officinale]